ncbi:MAG: hypothetical protein JO032_00975 [Alphaproteobacteria bacterium]|nr:hypothetical protein [Alphaproteobacteria bacterium]
MTREQKWMRCALVLGFALAPGLCGCAPPVYVAEAPPPVMLVNPALAAECAMIGAEIARQRRIADLSGVMATALVEGAVRVNVTNAIGGLEKRAAIEGCP